MAAADEAPTLSLFEWALEQEGELVGAAGLTHLGLRGEGTQVTSSPGFPICAVLSCVKAGSRARRKRAGT